MPDWMRRPQRIFWAGVFFALVFPPLAALPVFALDSPPLKKVTLITAWLPQAQFAGFYAAQEKEIYKKYGLDVSIVHGQPNRLPFEALQEGSADVAIFWLAFGIQKRSEGIPVVHIAQIVQKSALMLIAKKTSGIRTPRDMAGRKVGLWDEIYQVQPKALFEKFGITAAIVPQAYSVNLFLRGGVDVVSAMWYNEYHTILNSGYDPGELTAFFFSEYDLNFPEDGLYVLEEKFAADPGRYAAFVKASLEGWQYAFEHEKEILDIVLRRVKETHMPADYVHQKWMLNRMRDVISPEAGKPVMGILAEEDYARTARVLKEKGLIGEIPAFREFYKFEECSGGQ